MTAQEKETKQRREKREGRRKRMWAKFERKGRRMWEKPGELPVLRLVQSCLIMVSRMWG